MKITLEKILKNYEVQFNWINIDESDYKKLVNLNNTGVMIVFNNATGYHNKIDESIWKKVIEFNDELQDKELIPDCVFLDVGLIKNGVRYDIQNLDFASIWNTDMNEKYIVKKWGK